MSICSSRSGLVHRALRAAMPAARRGGVLLPESALAAGRDPADRPGALPLRLSVRARDVPDRRAPTCRSRADARRRPLAASRARALPLARPALAVGVALVLLETLNDIGASEYLGVRTLTWRSSPPGSTAAAWPARRRSPGRARLVVAADRDRTLGRRKVSVEFSAEAPRLRLALPLSGGRALARARGLRAAGRCSASSLPAAYLLRESAAPRAASADRSARCGATPGIRCRWPPPPPCWRWRSG